MKIYSVSSQNISIPVYSPNFTSRVDKSFMRFYETNEARMPVTLKNYIAGVNDKSILTPISAMKKAFEYLALAKTVGDIKDLYPNEPLFKNIISPKQAKSVNGIIGLIKQDEEILSLSGDSLIKGGSDFTTYLIKKIFLENKSIKEINVDLENDLHEDFKADFKFKYPESRYVHKSTISALGITPPNQDYRNSLRYTDEGYADMMGEKVSAGLLNFWDSMSEEERTARAKKSVMSFENWWKSLSKNEILARIARQTTILEMLKEYKSFKKAEIKPNIEEQKDKTIAASKTHIKTGSAKLSNDELFLRWASNNLKIYLENMSEADKDTLHIKRMQHLVSRWAQMTPAERTDYISKMKSGLEPLKFAMIDAWNHSLEIIVDLSKHMKANQIYKPADLLYSTEEFSEFQSRIMTEFWTNHPEHAKTLGKNITLANEKINLAISRGTFEELKKEIMRDKNKRIKDLNTRKNTEVSKVLSEQMKNYKDLLLNVYPEYQILPEEYVLDYLTAMESEFTPEEIALNIKNLKYKNSGRVIENKDLDEIYNLSIKDRNLCPENNRALEAALASILYSCTSNPAVYFLSHSELKNMLARVLEHEPTIYVYSPDNDKTFKFSVKNFNLSKEKIKNLYQQYKRQIPDEYLDEIAQTYFETKDGSYENLIKYLKTYGKSLEIIFSEKSLFSKDIKTNLFNKFMNNMPEEISKNNECVYSRADNPFEFEENLQHAMIKENRELSFLPANFREEYLKNVIKCMRKILDPEDSKNLVSESGMVFVHKFELPQDLQLKVLAMETALGDMFYDATKSIFGYEMHLESFASPIGLLKNEKHYPADFHFQYNELNDEPVNLTAYKRFNFAKLNQKYFEYYNELKSFMTEKHENSVENLDLVYILNTDENFKAKDDALLKKLTVFYDIKFNMDSRTV